MSVYESVSTLSSIRNFLEKDVSDEIIMKILQAGRLAPSAHNDQPWKFILIRDKNRIKELQKYCLSGSFVSRSAFSVVIITDRESKWFQIDGTRAVQNMVLTAWDCGIGTCWIGRIDDTGLRKYLNIPDKWHILTVLPFGYFDTKLIPSTKFRKSEKDLFYEEEYGNELSL